MIMWIPQLICCGIHMKSEINVDQAASARGRPRAGPHGHHVTGHHAIQAGR